MKQLTLTTHSAEETERIGEIIGSHLQGGETIELSSDLGGGKTTFVRGVARGARSLDRVASPTFTISKVYETSDFEIYHFDFYRLNESGLIAHELAEVINDPSYVVIVEWAEVVQGVLPADKISLHIARTSETGRKLQFSYADAYQPIFEGLNAE